MKTIPEKKNGEECNVPALVGAFGKALAEHVADRVDRPSELLEEADAKAASEK